MAAITEDYVSFETARLLEEKGFSENTEHKIWYVIKQFSTGCHWNSCTYKVGDTTREYDEDCCIPMPTLQMAMKWLRAVHTIHIVIKIVMRTYGDTEYYYELYGTKNKSLCVVCDIYKGETWSRSEKATEEAIKYCLKHLI